MAGQYRRWCFTLNNYSEEQAESVKKIECKYIVVGKEVGESGTPHLQGYIEFVGAKRLGGVKKLLDTAHWEGAKAGADKNQKYCGKENIWWESGEPGKPGNRTDLSVIKKDMKEGASIRSMLETDKITTTGGLKFAESIAKYIEKKRDAKPEVIWIFGESGGGKSRLARTMVDMDDCYIKAGSCSKWWDGYDGHKCLIIDDFRDSAWALLDILAVLDRYEHRVEFKGGMRQLLATKIIVTSIHPPELCYINAKGEPLKQLKRRIDQEIDICDTGVTEVSG
ncbi:MAG: putative viral replication protein [Incitativirus reperis]|uniref:Replication-associated protein n=1 Tax=Cressdnaviricota sp. TaxID=2748378 RepID=A0A345MRT3_9VIRU|nr:MAG: putative viral replication protein [Cressdnaviricota sp.]